MSISSSGISRDERWRSSMTTSRRFGRVSIEHVALMRSDVSPRGARYAVLSAVPLLP